MLITGQQIDGTSLASLESHGAVVIDTRTDDPTEMVDLALSAIGHNGTTNLMLEGGGDLIASFFAADQIDECHVYIGAKALGGECAPGPIGGGGIEKIHDARSFELVSVDQFDNDLRAVYRKIET